MASVDNTRLITAMWAPGAVTANASTDMPVNYPEIEQLMGGLHLTSIGDDYTPTDLAVKATTATPGAGYISPVDGNSFRVGTTCDTKTKLVILYKTVSGVNDDKYVTAHWSPGAVSADTEFDIPSIYPLSNTSMLLWAALIPASSESKTSMILPFLPINPLRI